MHEVNQCMDKDWHKVNIQQVSGGIIKVLSTILTSLPEFACVKPQVLGITMSYHYYPCFINKETGPRETE